MGNKSNPHTHTCDLNLPWLPPAATKVHIVPGVVHTSLVSIKTLCDAGCKVNYDANERRVNYKDTIVWRGQREPTTGVWVLQLDPNNNFMPEKPQNNPKAEEKAETANNAYTITSKGALIQYLHQCLFCLPKKTLLKAIVKNQFTTWPGLTYNAVKNCLPGLAPKTDKGHMKCQRRGVRSTKEKLKEYVEYERDMHPPQI